jgi:hypothetical protein
MMGRDAMMMPDTFCEYYEDYLDGVYDCVDRIVLNAYFILAQSSGGFRTWWRQLMGNDDTLDNAHLMRFAGRFSRRIRAYAKKHGIPLIHCERGERKDEIAKEHIPTDGQFRGVFCILSARCPAPVVDVQRYGNGGIDIKKKTPQPYVNQYSFHIMDPEWGHITIKLCPHPPFTAQIMLNGHEYVATHAKKMNISCKKTDNCFTEVSDAAGLARVADTMRAPCSVGRLMEVCERWIYSACLCFALELVEQEKTGFHYSYSVYQVEYSRNLLFTRGRIMDQVFNGVIDRTRAPLDIKMVKTLFGSKHRLFNKRRNEKPPRCELVIERPVYDLTVFKIHFGKLSLKMYSKGERVLRIEVIAHNTRQLHCGKGIARFPQITQSLKSILDRFLGILHGADVSFIDIGTLETWPLPSKVGATVVGGVDVNRPRMRAVLEAVMALSTNPRGFTASQLAEKVMEILDGAQISYQSRHASYDLKKLRGKQLIRLVQHSRRYEATQDGLRTIAAFLVLREKVLSPLLSSVNKGKTKKTPRTQSDIDIHYGNIKSEMQKVFQIIGIAA